MNSKEILTIILAGGRGERIHPLTRDRAKPSVPFGGIYRIIDFPLSNAINSGLRKIYILTQYKSFSLQTHIRRAWGILSRELGEFIDMVPAQQRIGDDWYQGTADSVFQNLHLMEEEMPKYVLILSGDQVYKMDYKKLIDFHIEKGAPLTMSVFETPVEQAGRFGVMKVEDGLVKDFEEKPAKPFVDKENPGVSLISMGIYVFNLNTLIQEVIRDAKIVNSSHDFGKDIIPRMIKENRVGAFRFIDENKKESKYWRDIGTIEAYWEANMDLVSIDPLLNLYDKKWPIRNFIESLPPAKTVFSHGERRASVRDSLVAGGCIVSGGRVHTSILSPSVRVNSFAEVSESILFDNVNVGRYSRLHRTIVDKNVIIPPETEIGFNRELDSRRFYVSSNGITVIPKNYKW